MTLFLLLFLLLLLTLFLLPSTSNAGCGWVSRVSVHLFGRGIELPCARLGYHAMSAPSTYALDPRCLATRCVWTPDPRYMAPELRRGCCGGCGGAITIYHARYYDTEKRVYYHCDPACVPAARLELLGSCGFCGEDVFFPLQHAQHDGVWYHGEMRHRYSCWRRKIRWENGVLSEVSVFGCLCYCCS